LDSLRAGSFSAVRTALTRQSIAVWNCVSDAALGPRIMELFGQLETE
jgi:hypothetical protein